MLAVAFNISFDPGGEGVHHGNTHAVEAAGHGIGFGVEFAAGVQLSHNNLNGGSTGGVHFHGNATAVINDFDTAISKNGHLDFVGVAGHCFIHRVIHNLPHQVV